MKKKFKKRSFVALLMAFLMMSSSMSVLAAKATEPAMQPSDDVIVIDVTDDGMRLADGQDIDDGEVVIVNAEDDAGIMPLSEVRGYAAKYTNPLKGTFSINVSGGSSNSAYLQVAAREFANSPTINVTLYRPDGSYAGQVYLSGNGTKSIRFSNAASGTYTGAYGVAGSYGGWLDFWISW